MNRQILWTLVLTVTVIGAGITSIEAKTDKSAKAASATVVMTSKSIGITPAALQTGSTDFKVINKSAQRRGFVISTKDTAGTPTFRYTPLIDPGGSCKMNYRLYPGRSYEIKGYTGTRVVGTERRFDIAYRAVLPMRGAADYSRGPRPSTNKIYAAMSDQDLKVSSAVQGAATFIITNKSSLMKGLVLSGKDIGGTPMVRYSKLIKPGEASKLTTWLYNGQTYTLRDYTSMSVEQGKGPTFESQYSQPLTVAGKAASTE